MGSYIKRSGTVSGSGLTSAQQQILDIVVTDQGDHDASSGVFPSANKIGQSWVVDTAGTIDGIEFEIGDRIIARTVNPSTTVFEGSWLKSDNTMLRTDEEIANATTKVTPDGDDILGYVDMQGPVPIIKKFTWNDHITAVQDSLIIGQMGVTVGNYDSNYLTDDFSDQTQINEAIVYLNSLGGGIVLLKDHLFDITGLLTLRENVFVVGQGWSTILKRNQTRTVGRIFYGTGITNAGVKNLMIDGSSDLMETPLENMESLRVDLSSDILIDNVFALNSPGEGIQLHRCTRSKVQRSKAEGTVEISGSHKAGIIISGSSNTEQSIGCSIVGCDTLNTSGEGIGLYYSKGCRLIGNNIDWSSGVDNNCQIQLEQSENSTVVGNTVNSNYVGIVNLSCDNMTITGNNVLAAKNQGMIISGSSKNVTVTGNVFNSMQEHGVFIYDLASSITVIGNTIVNAGLKTNNTYDAIHIDPNGGYVRRVTIFGNTASATETNKIRAFLGTTTDTNNQIEDLFEKRNHSTGHVSEFRMVDNAEFVTIMDNEFKVSTDGTGDYNCDNVEDEDEIHAAMNTCESLGGGMVELDGYLFKISDTLKVPNKVFLVAKGRDVTTLQMDAGTNKTCIQNKNYDNGIDENLGVMNMTIDQQGATQNGGGGITMSGVKNSIFKNLKIKNSYRFNMLILHSAGAIANNAGTINLTSNDRTVTGTGTSFLTDYKGGSIIKSGGNKFARVESVESDTSLTLRRVWYWTTETGATHKTILPNEGNKFEDIIAEGTEFDADSIGLGFCDYAHVSDCDFSGAAGGGCGLVPDHCEGMLIENIKAHDNENSGLSLETTEYSTIINAKLYNNGLGSGNGLQLISGTQYNSFYDVIAKNNTSNGAICNFLTGAQARNDHNKFYNCLFNNNGSYGFRYDGCSDNFMQKCEAKNNGAGGFLQNTANGQTPDRNKWVDCDGFDDQTTATQDRGFYLVTGDSPELIRCNAYGNTVADYQINGAVTNPVTRHNEGYKTSNTGVATILDATTSITVTHGLNITPTIDKIILTATNNPTVATGNPWVSGITSTQFVINVPTDPSTSGASFAWNITD